MNAKHDTVDRTSGVAITSDLFSGMTFLVVDPEIDTGDRPAAVFDFDGKWSVELIAQCPLCPLPSPHLTVLGRDLPQLPVAVQCRRAGDAYDVDIVGVRANVLETMQLSPSTRDYVLNLLPQLKYFMSWELDDE